MEAFNSRKLPPVRGPNQISRSSAVTEVVTYAVTALWWVDILRLPEIPGISFRLGPVIARTYHWPVLVLLLALTAMGVVNTIWPSWTRRRAGAALAIHAYGLALVGLLLFAGPLVLAFCGIDYTLRGIQDFRRMRGFDPIQNWVMRLFTGESCRAV